MDSKIIELYQSGKSIRKVSDEIGVSGTQIRRILKRNGIRSRSLRTDQKIEKDIIEKYKSGISSEKIAKDVQLDASTVCRVLKRNGIDIKGAGVFNKKYNINDSFLDRIDTEEKAYFLGFMYADGAVHKEGPSFKLELHKKDNEINKKFQDLLFIGKKSKIGIDREKYVYFTVRSKQLKESLIIHGCPPRKSFKIRLPKHLSKNLMRHFIRGIFDGDGCISIGDSRVRVCLTGYSVFLKDIKNYFDNDYIYYKEYTENVGSLWIYKNSEIIEFLEYLYKDSNIYLDRKYAKYQEAMEILSEKTEVPFNYGTTNIISYKGQKLTEKYIKSITKEEAEEAAVYVFEFLRNNGFPYPEYSDSDMLKDFIKLQKVVVQTDGDRILKLGTAGIKIFHNYCPHFFEVTSDSRLSMVQAFHDDDLLKKVIRNRMGIDDDYPFNITGQMIRQGLRNAYAAFAASTFKPVLAKGIYDILAPEDSVVLDISAGFGQRMLGAMASKNVKKYIGLDPWDKQISAITQMTQLLSLEENVELYQIGSEEFLSKELKVDFCFSSPPFFNKEVYCSDETQAYHGSFDYFINHWWERTYQNVYSMLKDNGLFVLNMDDDMMQLMLKKCSKFKLIGKKYVLYNRSHMSSSSVDNFYILSKI